MSSARSNREVRRTSANLGNEVAVARARLATLRASLQSVTGEMSANSADSVRLRELEREAAASREVYESYLQRYQEIADQDQLNTSDARLLAYAREPRSPSSPKLRISLAIAIAAGLFMGLAAGVIAELFDQSVKNADELEAKVGYPRHRVDPDYLQAHDAPDAAGRAAPFRLSGRPADVGLHRSAARAAHGDRLFQARFLGEGRRDHLGAAGRRQDHDLDVPRARCGHVWSACLVVDCDLRKQIASTT